MRKFFSALVLVPLGLIFTVFAVANRHLVTVSFDPRLIRQGRDLTRRPT